MIGIQFGTYDPPHRGHRRVARIAIEVLGLTAVYLVPNAAPSWKPEARPLIRRAAMVRLEASKEADLFVLPTATLLNLAVSGDYVKGVVRHVQSRHPDEKLVRLSGADSFMRHGLAKLAVDGVEVAVVQRPGEKLTLNGQDLGRLHVLPSSGTDLSSTRLRRELSAGIMPEGMEADVARYALEHRLY